MVRYVLRTGAAVVAVSVCLMTLAGATAQDTNDAANKAARDEAARKRAAEKAAEEAEKKAAAQLSPGPNGIHVGEAKLFDERTLMQMLEAAENNLASLRFYDQQG